jgi:PPP family 3-phenylpropionic acid transporter
MFFGLLLVTRFIPVAEYYPREALWLGLKKLFGSWPVIIFLGVALGGGIGLSMIHHYLFLYLDQLGASSKVMGWSLTVATISELVVMFYSDRLLRWWGARGLLLVSLGALVLRLMAYAYVNSPGWVLLIQLLHGPTFAALWMASVDYVAEIAPAELKNTAQGLLTGFVMGLGSTLGALIGGVLFEVVGFAQMFFWTGMGVLLLMIFFWLGCRERC